MVLRAHVALHPFSMSTALLVNVFPRLIGTDERDRFDVRMLADEIDSRVLAVYNVQQSWWRAAW